MVEERHFVLVELVVLVEQIPVEQIPVELVVLVEHLEPVVVLGAVLRLGHRQQILVVALREFLELQTLSLWF
jgi:hypothetical protein